MAEQSIKIALGVALAALALAGGTGLLPIVGLVGFALFPVAIVLFLLVAVRVRAPEAMTGHRVLARGLYVVGVTLLVVAVAHGTSAAYATLMARARPSQPPASLRDWMLACEAGVAAALIMGCSLHTLARWPAGRCVAWALAVLATPLAAVAVLIILSRWWPLTA